MRSIQHDKIEKTNNVKFLEWPGTVITLTLNVRHVLLPEYLAFQTAQAVLPHPILLPSKNSFYIFHRIITVTI